MAYAVPYASKEASKVTAPIVFMVRVPGSLEKVGHQDIAQVAAGPRREGVPFAGQLGSVGLKGEL
eukprot:2409591-Lingulodinium_polyedra.AAC.1